jgi:hypothetical protein
MNINNLIIHHENQRTLANVESPKYDFHNDAVIYLRHIKTLLGIVEANASLMTLWVEEAEQKGITNAS